MHNRTTTLTSTSTVFAAVLAGTGLMSTGGTPARAADDCLSGPKHQTSAGGHWYYRLDRQNRRKCWYLADEGQKIDRVPAAKPQPSVRKNAQQATETIRQSNADARAEFADEVPAPRYTEQPQIPSASAKPDAEPFTDGPPKSAPEDPVPPGGNALSNSAPAGDGEPATTNAMTNPMESASADAAPEALPTAANEEPTAQLPEDETAMSTLRLTLSLLLMAMGLAAVTAGVIFKRSNSEPAGDDDVPFRMPDTAGEPEEAFEERASLALTRDVPLFLVRGQPGSD
jgi:hypothetical protein